MGEVSLAQEGVWFTEQAGIAGTAYHMALCLSFSGKVDREALGRACESVLARHPALAETVVVEEGVPRLVPAARPPELVRAPLHGGLLADQVSRGFDLSTGPLARAILDDAGPRPVLLFVAHHLVFDGMSKDVLVRDLAQTYTALLAGRAVPGGRDVGSTDAGSSAVEHHRLQRDRVAQALPAAGEFWRGHWQEPDSLVLPGLTRIPTMAEPGATVDTKLDTQDWFAVDEAARRIEATRFEVLLAAVQALLFRYGNASPMVAIELSTRSEQVNDEIGLFVNELPVTLPEPAAYEGTFRQLVHAVRAELHGVYQFREVPFGRAVTGLRPRTALAPVSVSYRRRPGSTPSFAGADVSVDWTVFSGTARNALEIQFVDDGDQLTVSLRFSPAALDPEAAVRIAEQLRALLRSAVTDPDQLVPSLALLPAGEFDRVIREWNATEKAYPAQATLPSLFAEQALRTPDEIAATGPGLHAAVGGLGWEENAARRTVSYRELSTMVDRLAGALRARGIGRGDLVGVCLPRSVELLASLLAVAAAGAAYVPVDPAHPAPRRAMILAEAGPRLLITTGALAAQADGDQPVLLLGESAVDDQTRPDQARPDQARPDQAGAGAGPADLPPGPDDLAYVMFTSGSTGRPKGASIPHRALANLLLSMAETLGGGCPPGEVPGGERRPVWLGLTSVAFDISALELFLPLITGGRVVIVPDGAGANGAAVVELIARHGVTHVQATPSGWRTLLAGGFGADPAPGGPSIVALAGGEALGLPLARELRRRVRRLFNVYGPTETTIWSTMAELPEQIEEVTIGAPIANTRVYLLDTWQNPVPIGVPGELYLGGAGLATGYLGSPGPTTERFPADPFVSGARMYRTGDRGRYLPDGRIVFLGRLDNQVKVRGHRLELGEIEAHLLSHPAVAEAAVVLRADETDPSSASATESRLVAYLVPHGEPEPELVPAIRKHLSSLLPAAAVPQSWVTLTHIPLTPNGKLDRLALPAPPRQRQDASGPDGLVDEPVGGDGVGDADTDPLTEEIRQIWCEVLQIDDIRVDEDLFDLGGHSLTITGIIGRIEQNLGVTLPFDDFFETPTCLGVAAAVRRERQLMGDGGDAA